ncbi:MAG: Ig-like domain-containing protein [Bacteroidota bacterium]
MQERSFNLPFSGRLYLTLGMFLYAGFSLLGQKSAPIATDDTYQVGINATLVVNAGNGLLANDSDANGNNTMSVRTTPVTASTSGAVTLNTDGSFTYVPNSGYVGPDSFTYQVCDDGTPSVLVSRFDFDTATITDATIGPDATSVNSNAAQIGCGIHFPSGAGGSTGFDIVVPNATGIFDFTSFTISFEYQDQESTADIVTAGNFRIYHITGNEMGIRATVINGTTGLSEEFVITLGNFVSGNNPYSVGYSEITGEVTYTANGSTSTFAFAPPNSPLDTSLATDVIIGRFMDGSGSSLPSLCSMEFVDDSVLCDTGNVGLTVISNVITNRNITYRVRPN